MQLKTLLLSAVALFVISSSYAQDKIYKRSGDIVDAKIKSVGTKTITYVRYDNQTGPEYTIVKAEVQKIKYMNGSEDEFPGRGRKKGAGTNDQEDAADKAPGKKAEYGASVITISPMQFSENGLGLGLSYEHAIDKKGIIAFYLPVAATFNLNSNHFDPNTGNTVNGHQDAMFYVMPGVKVYPTGSFGSVRYAVGPSLVIGDGEKSTMDYSYSSGNPAVYNTKSHFVLGIMVNNSLNINPTPHIYLGLELGLGFTYMNRVDAVNQNTLFLAQGGFRIGYRF